MFSAQLNKLVPIKLFRGNFLPSVLRNLLVQVCFVATLGLLISVCANMFVIGLQYFERLRSNPKYVIKYLEFEIAVLPMLFLILSVGLVILLKNMGNIQKWENPADIIFCAQNQKVNLQSKHSFFSVLASFISLAGGASLGQYGPIVHLGGTIGAIFSNLLAKINLSRDVLIGCGVAAAISAGFNAPIAGILFSHEAVLRHFSARAVALISISSICASAFDGFLFATDSIFEIGTDFSVSSEMMFISLLAGTFFGLSAMSFIKLFFMVNKFANRSKYVSRFFFVIGLFYLILLSQFVPDAIGMGMNTINDLFNGVRPLDVLLILLVAKITAVFVSANIGFAGGFFGPALFVGAVIGALLGHFASFLGISTLTTMLVVSGSAAVAGTVFGAPIAMVLLVLELTYSYDLALAAMLSIVVSSLICHLFFGHSLFDLQLLNRDIDLGKGRVFLELETIQMSELASSNYLSFKPKDSAEFILKKMTQKNATESYCIDENGVFLGKILIHRVLENLDCHAENIADSNCMRLFASQSMNSAIKTASNFVGESLPVIRKDDNYLLGIVSEADLFNSYIQVSNMVRKIETS